MWHQKYLKVYNMTNKLIYLHLEFAFIICYLELFLIKKLKNNKLLIIVKNRFVFHHHLAAIIPLTYLTVKTLIIMVKFIIMS